MHHRYYYVPKINQIEICTNGIVTAFFDNGDKDPLFQFNPKILSFHPEEFKGMTKSQAIGHRFLKEIAPERIKLIKRKGTSQSYTRLALFGKGDPFQAPHPKSKTHQE